MARQIDARIKVNRSNIITSIVAQLVADERAQRAVGGRGAGVDVQTATCAGAIRINRLPVTGSNGILGANTATNAEAGVGAGDVEEASAVSRADADVFNGSCLPRGKIGSVSPGDRGDAGGGTEEEALNELHW